MANLEVVSLKDARDVFKAARQVIGEVPVRAREYHANWLSANEDDINTMGFLNVFGATVMTSTGPKILVDFSLGATPHSFHFGDQGSTYNSLFAEAKFVTFDNPDVTNPSSARADTNGYVLCDGDKYDTKNPGIIPLRVLGGDPRRRRMAAIAGHTQSGLVVARFAELCSAMLANRQPDTAAIDHVQADLVGHFGDEMPMKENVAALQTRF